MARCCLVDDEQKDPSMLGQALRGEGHDVVEAAVCERRSARSPSRSVDVLIVDNLMPDATGWT